MAGPPRVRDPQPQGVQMSAFQGCRESRASTSQGPVMPPDPRGPWYFVRDPEPRSGLGSLTPPVGAPLLTARGPLWGIDTGRTSLTTVAMVTWGDPSTARLADLETLWSVVPPEKHRGGGGDPPQASPQPRSPTSHHAGAALPEVVGGGARVMALGAQCPSTPRLSTGGHQQCPWRLWENTSPGGGVGVGECCPPSSDSSKPSGSRCQGGWVLDNVAPPAGVAPGWGAPQAERIARPLWSSSHLPRPHAWGGWLAGWSRPPWSPGSPHSPGCAWVPHKVLGRMEWII